MESCSPSAGFMDDKRCLQELSFDIMNEVDKLTPFFTRINDHAAASQQTTEAALAVNFVIFNYIYS